MRKNYVSSYKIFPAATAGYAINTILLYLYCTFIVWKDGGSDPLGSYLLLALLSLASPFVLIIGAHTTYLALKKNESCEKWPPIWKHIALLAACIAVGIPSFVLGLCMLTRLPTL